MPTPPSELERVIAAMRQRIVNQDAEQMRAMAKRWMGVENALADKIDILVARVAELKSSGETISASRLYELDRYKSLLSQARTETNKYAKWAADDVVNKQSDMISQGVNDAYSTIDATLKDGQTRAFFNRLPSEAVDCTVGYTADGTPLEMLLRKSYPETIAKLTQALIDGNAMGRNPRATALAMLDAMGGNLQRALTVARTEQIRAYRTANTEAMKASGVVDGWIWRCALNDRTCPACLAMDGTEHDLNEELNDHPNGRCFKQPIISGLDRIESTSGSDWFENQSEATQKNILGRGNFEAWKAGQFEFSQLATIKQDAVWGAQVRIAPLENITDAEWYAKHRETLTREFMQRVGKTNQSDETTTVVE